MKPHPQLKNCHGQNLSRVRIAAFGELGSGFLEICNNRTQPLVRIRNQTQPIV